MQGNEYEKYRLQSVEKSINILNLFYDAEELGAAEVAAKMGMTRGTAFRFLTTLEMNGLLIRTSKARYRLACNCILWGSSPMPGSVCPTCPTPISRS